MIDLSQPIIRPFDTHEFFEKSIHGVSILEDNQRYSRTFKEPRWSGTPTFKDASDLAVNGWKDGMERIYKMNAAIENVIGSKIERHAVQYDVAGSCPDVGRYLSGAPDSMMSFVPDETNAHGKIVKVVLNIAVSWDISIDVLIARGAAVCALLQGLQEAGMSSELDICMCIVVSGRHYSQWINAKRATDAMEMDRIAFMCAHPSMLRRMSLSVSEQEPSEIINAFGFSSSGNYGRPDEAPEAMRGDVYLGKALSGNVQWEDVESASKWVSDTLKAQGVVINEEVGMS